MPEYAPKRGYSGVLDGVIGAQLVYNLDRLSGIQIMEKIRLVVRDRAGKTATVLALCITDYVHVWGTGDPYNDVSMSLPPRGIALCDSTLGSWNLGNGGHTLLSASRRQHRSCFRLCRLLSRLLFVCLRYARTDLEPGPGPEPGALAINRSWWPPLLKLCGADSRVPS